MLAVQQADFEKIKSEYDVTILIAGKRTVIICIVFILCILALHGFASKSPPFILILKVSQQVKIC